MRTILVDFRPHGEQRYDTLDDYRIYPGGLRCDDTDDFLCEGPRLHVTISDTGDPRSNFALMIHALTEQFCAEQAGVTIEQIDEWDLSHPGAEEPAEMEGCPYYQPHMKAMLAETWICEVLGLPWADHEVNLENVGKIVKDG